jgi:hypothetical protein
MSCSVIVTAANDPRVLARSISVIFPSRSLERPTSSGGVSPKNP